MKPGIIFGNRIIDVVFIAWFIAQFYKVISAIIFDKKLDIKRFWETGGMPSSHSSTATSLATSIAIVEGMASSYFAIAVIFSGIIMYDAAGIRRAAGKQAGVLNKIVERLTQKIEERIHDENLKELLGHTPFEVLIGALLGIVVGLLMKKYLLA
ncbi:divergent PAP2 family protein [uncultured Ilyobacter sp.]|uniref:divergent PAP2 family protein n=1 Tax=uncultured Ilyobacter sp. TaxID=544433 RepID=UPI0029F4F080|nr:divergent PAP2 family protein [uncultured Ilyobacter sp.]